MHKDASGLSTALAGLVWPRRTARLVLRPITVADAQAAFAYRGDPEAMRFVGHGVLDLDQVIARHRERVRRMQPGVADPMLGLAVEDASGMVGDCMLDLARDGQEWVGWIGYSLSPAVHGRGYATEVARELVVIAGALGLRELFATARPGNLASHKVLLKCGFTPVPEMSKPDSVLFRRVIQARAGRRGP